MNLVPLNIHTEYSLLQSTIRLKGLCAKAKEYGYTSIAVTDLSNMFGAVEFFAAAKAQGLHPIIGSEICFSEDDEAAADSNLVFLVQNEQGYRNLCQLSSKASQRNSQNPSVNWEDLETYHEGLFVLTGGEKGLLRRLHLEGQTQTLSKFITKAKKVFGSNLYLQILTGSKDKDELNDFLVSLGKKEKIQTALGVESYFLDPTDQIYQEMLQCVKEGKQLYDEDRPRLSSSDFYFSKPEAILEKFAKFSQAIENTSKISQACTFEFVTEDKQGNPIYHLPSYNKLTRDKLDVEIKKLASQGLKKRFSNFKKVGIKIDDEKVYWDRLEYELGVIRQMGFSGYFLVVQDFIRWSKDNDVPVGPGRGSGAGSLVAYTLEITDLDPIKYDLLFERFLNPDRVSMPDFDIDFCQHKRPLVLDYVRQKYGADNVSQIITYGRLQPKAAIRDIGRVLGLGYSQVDEVAKMVPNRLNITLQEALDEEPRLNEAASQDPRVKNLLDSALKVEGQVRHSGVHAAGVVMSDEPLVTYAPLHQPVDGGHVVQYDMKCSEKIGLIKFDFLGLKTLTMIQKAIELVEKNQGIKIDLNTLDIEDPKVYEFLGTGKTDGIFQFEGAGVTSAMMQMKPTGFRDIVVLTSLYRPGPMEMIPSFLDKRAGKKPVKYIFPELEGILAETYGVVVYQEQAMRIAVEIAGYSMSQSDILRRAMGKKQEDVMQEQRKLFVDGAVEKGFSDKGANKVFDQLAEFAKYGFNKSHAAAYGVISFYTSYLKFYYPKEFYAALFSLEMSDTDKLMRYFQDAKKTKVEVVPPHVNISDSDFEIKDGKISYALGAIKGLGEAVVERIVEARETNGGSFDSLDQFFSEVPGVGKKVAECLIKAGALDDFGLSRAELWENYPTYIQAAEFSRKEKELGQSNLFGSLGQKASSDNKLTIKRCAPWGRSKELAEERAAIGFYLSSHPAESLTGVFDFISADLADLNNFQDKAQVCVMGVGYVSREFLTRKGTLMCYLVLEDRTASVDVVVFPDVYKDSTIHLHSEGLLCIEAEVRKEEGVVKLFAQSIRPLLSKVQSGGCYLKLAESKKEILEKVDSVLSKYPGETPFNIRFSLEDLGVDVNCLLGQSKSIRLEQGLFDDIYQISQDSKANLQLIFR